MGNENKGGAGATFHLDGSGNLQFLTANFYLGSAEANSSILNVSQSQAADRVNLSSLTDGGGGTINAGDLKLSLRGNRLMPGQTLTLAKGESAASFTGNTDTVSGNEVSLTDGNNIISDSTGVRLNSSFYQTSDYQVYWLNNALVLGLSPSAMIDNTGVIGRDTDFMWFTGSLTDAGVNGSYMHVNDPNRGWAEQINGSGQSRHDYYQSLSPNAKDLYYNLSFRTDELGFAQYLWSDNSNDAMESRHLLVDYFSNTLPAIVTASGGSISRDRLIADFMNSLDPQIHVRGGTDISHSFVKMFNQTLSGHRTLSGQADFSASIARMLTYFPTSAEDEAGGLELWVNLAHMSDKLSNQSHYSGYSGRHFGGFVGLEKTFDRVVAGVAVGAGQSSLDWSNDSKTDGDIFMVQGYGRFSRNNYFADFSAGVGKTRLDASRYVGPFKKESEYDVDFFNIDLRAGYDFVTAYGLTFSPQIGLSYINTKQEAFEEKGIAAMRFDRLKAHSLEGSIGLEVRKTIMLENGVELKPLAMVGLSHEFSDSGDCLRSSFIGQPSVYVNNCGYDKKRTAFDLGLALEANLKSNIEAFVRYNGRFKSKYNSQDFSFGLNYKF